MGFSLRRFFFCVFLSGIFFSAATISRAQGPREATCSAANLDLTVSPPLQSQAELDGHSIAVEIQNRDEASCLLDSLAFRFPPFEDKQSIDPRIPQTSQSNLSTNEISRELKGGEIIHFLLAWSSIPLPVPGLVMDDCTAHDTMTLFWNSFAVTKPLLEVRQLGMKTCGHYWTSSYRPGRYVPGEPVGEDWFKYSHLKQSDFLVSPVPPEPEEDTPNFSRAAGRARAMAASASPSVTLRSLYDIEYLKDTFESGYSGYFELFLKVPAPAISNCPFDSLRKREADGQTLVYLNRCDNFRAQPRVDSSAKEIRLLIRELGLLPERPGRVEYDVVSEVLENGRPAMASARTTLSMRDAKWPILPTIDTDTPSCRLPQLKTTNPPMELGNHWSEPRNYAPSGERWQRGKILEVTNVSNEDCMLGGVPGVSFLRASEKTSGGIMAPVCRDCATSLFKPRGNRWIDLKPNDSAHLIAVSTTFDQDFSFLCNVLGGINLLLAGEKELLHLPFEAAFCDQIAVSSWREGRYDDDPMNIRYDLQVSQREKQPAANADPLPKECEKEVSADTGRPVMFPKHSDLLWGVSTKPATWGEPVPVLLWLHNPTDTPQPVMTCSGIEWFWALGIDVFEASGQRVLSVGEEKDKKKPDMQGVLMCTRNFAINIPPHACIHGNFSTLSYDFSTNLEGHYSLPPGRYMIVPGERGPDLKPVRRTLPAPSNGLSVVVQEP